MDEFVAVWTVEKEHEKVDIQENQVYNVEVGRLISSDDYISPVSMKFRVSVSCLKTGEGEMNAVPETDGRILEWLSKNQDVI